MKKHYKYIIFIKPDLPEGYYVTVPALPGCFSSGKTVEEAIENAKEAIDLHLEVLEEQHQPIVEDSGSLIYGVEFQRPVGKR
ncbi:hypothetical protein CO101_00515 [Candidatus Berkelbacteria bacterium CG_4_9_14_3_um_filter_39_23]|uniref:HicB-like antitoxin of toxin-antitoxin system domain-containing protein n=2 Tax=Candidatus Berkelbacteria TaxID=1618330 RepID=A0A2M7CI86_9BACT|nr:type II toxin-antitoxin system HicB family antitoxin [Candidatus Berkelbacteria bacterium]OIP05487.1 MAG: hypothetical protein AUK14_01580 [Candidatus Berkelbacteria bacterium CG2_30_39_44]PIR27618.1 MAG: hypothetical protein COV39_03520 [Candidatus Berkelbacteria bacterium CG11_big_fil_rev_8_21_14_0_20_40_23]PIV25346.1 MAG: hypothetical protein COS38_02020 [Candidatus Berkelbacteria bacterium CG03_land_8_20_14_0_80_40_36]PIZ29133.1 MAG: hypothetical protein COY44_00430 [Candidatus Berkelbac